MVENMLLRPTAVDAGIAHYKRFHNEFGVGLSFWSKLVCLKWIGGIVPTYSIGRCGAFGPLFLVLD